MPPDAEPYARHRLALAWLMALPGAPLLYYGDEYGQFGGADPNNRMMWHGDSVTGEEAATLAFARKVGSARKELGALRRGEYRSLLANEDDLVFARQDGADVVLVALTRRAAGATLDVVLPPTLPLADGAVLRDRIGGATTTVSGGRVSITLGARGAAYLAK
jgi:glycosidase